MTAPGAQPARWRPVARSLLKLALLGVVAYFVAAYVLAHIEQTRQQIAGANAPMLLVAVAMFILGDGILVLVWPHFLRATTGVAMSLRKSLWVCAMSWLSRYVPGKVWQIAGKAVLSAGSPAQRGKIATIVTLETLLIQLSACLLGALTLPVLARGLPGPAGWVWGAVAAVFALGLAVLSPRVLRRCANPLLRWVGQEPLELNVRRRAVFGFFLLYATPWLFYGLGAFATLRSLQPVPWAELPYVISAYAAGAFAGFASLFAPAGIGVREAVLGASLAARFNDPGLIIVVAAMTRLVATASELSFCALAFALRPKSNAPPAPQGE